MALLDYYFNPNTFRGIGGGLLDNLPEWLMQPGQGQFPPMALQGAQGGEEISSAGMQPQAPMSTQPQPQMPMGGGGAGEGSGLLSGLQGWLGNNSNMLIALGAGLAGGNGWSQGISQGLQGALKGRQLDQSQQSKTFLERALMQRGLDPQMARAVSSNPQLANAVLPNLFGAKSTDDIREYEYAKSQGFAGNLTDWMARKRQGAGEYGLTPIWGVDAEGNPAFIQPGKGGEAIQSKLPPGFKIARDPIKIDAGDKWILLDPQTRQPVGQMSKGIVEKEAQKKEGADLGEARALYAEMKSKMPGLEKVVAQLEDLSKKATYTYIGQGIDAVVRETGPVTGVHATPGAVARTEYSSIASNQIIPLLRATFGAQFTALEGERLQKTLVDPNLSPPEKQAIIRSFIAQKRRDVEALALRTGATPSPQAGQPPQPGQRRLAKEGDIVVNPETGEQMTVRNGQWVKVQ